MGGLSAHIRTKRDTKPPPCGYLRPRMRVCERCRSVYPSGTRFCGIDGAPLVNFVDDPLLGQRIGRYEVTALLGRGGCGSVYKAIHTELGSAFALKVLYGSLGGDERYVERFRREAQAVSRIRSPWVVSVVDFGTSESGLTYLVMEHCAGSPLDQILAADKVLDPARAARFTSQIASGLAVAHKVGLIHRDVKPANVMIEDNDGKEFAKLLDFGIVRVPELDASDKLTVEGAVMGTPPYMSPEQASGQEVTPQSDLYSLGVVLYQMLSSRKPFTGSAREIFHKHNHEPPPPLAMSGPVVDLCYALLAKSPAERPASAAAVAELAKRIEVDLRGGEASLDPYGNATAAIPRGASAVVSSPGTPGHGTPAHGLPVTPPPSAPAAGARGPITASHAAPSAELASVLDVSGALPKLGTSRAPRNLLLWSVVGALGLAAAGATALLLQEPPGPSSVPLVTPSGAPVAAAAALDAAEQALVAQLQARGLQLGDLQLPEATRALYTQYRAERAAGQPSASATLAALSERARTLSGGELAKLRLDNLDAAIAALGEKLQPAKAEELKTEYLDLYRQLQLATTDAEQAVMAEAVRRFEAKVAAL